MQFATPFTEDTCSAVVPLRSGQQLFVPHLEGEVGARLVAARPHHELHRLPVQVVRQVEPATWGHCLCEDRMRSTVCGARTTSASDSIVGHVQRFVCCVTAITAISAGSAPHLLRLQRQPAA
jgi:hypothetical protein